MQRAPFSSTTVVVAFSLLLALSGCDTVTPPVEACTNQGNCYDMASNTCITPGGTSPDDSCLICDPDITKNALVNKPCGSDQICQAGQCVGAGADASDASDGGADTDPDPGIDSVADTPVEVTPDNGPDAVVDAAEDAEPDAVIDAQPDTVVDAQADGMSDAAPDASQDTAPDMAQQDDGPSCTPDAAVQCAQGHPTSFDSCGNAGAVVETCPTNSVCSDTSSTEASCACTNQWGGDDCDVCPDTFDEASDCLECAAQWTGANCDVCPDTFDAATGCDECANNWTGADCDICPGNWDPAAGCSQCYPEWSGPTCSVQGCIVRVVQGASGSGASWSSPMGDLYSALTTASSLASPGAACAVWVQTGTFSAESETQPFIVPGNVELYGGFVGDEVSVLQRADPLGIDNVTRINPGAGKVFVETGGDNARLDGFVLYGGFSASYQEAVGTRVNGHTVTIANTVFVSNSSVNVGYGGLQVAANSNVTLQNVTFTANDSNAALYVESGATVTGDSVAFAGNGSSRVIDNFGSLTLTNSVLIGNQATYGIEGGVTMVNSTWSSNLLGAGATNGPATFVNTIFDDAPIGASSGSPTYTSCQVTDPGGLQPGFVTDPPGFVGVITGQWIEAVAVNDFSASRLTAAATVAPTGTLRGQYIQISPSDPRLFRIAHNDGAEVYVWGDLTGAITVDDPFYILDVRLTADSPCVNSGNAAQAPLFDIEGKPRVDPDIGAYEL